MGFRKNFGVDVRVADMAEHHELIAKILREDASIDRKNVAVAFQGNRIIGGQNHESGATEAFVNALRQTVPELAKSLTISGGCPEPGFVF